MRTFYILVRRELTSFFLSWIGYVIIAAVLFLVGFGFASLLTQLNGESTSAPVTQMFFGSYYFWPIVWFVSPVITMRSFALERSAGTYETLMTTPTGEGRVVLAKFTGALIFFMVMWLPLLACLAIVRRYSNEVTAFDYGTVGSTYLGILLLGSLYMSLGVCTSALTRSQIIAAILSVAIGFTLWTLSYVSEAATSHPWMSNFFPYVRMVEHMHDFSQGIVDSRPIVFYLTMTGFFLFLTWKLVQGRR